MRIAALGRTQFLYDTILALRERGHQIAIIGTSAASPEYTRTEEDFARLAQHLGCPYFCQARLLEPACFGRLVEANAEVAISVNWQTLIPERVLQLFPHGVLNSHMGDLPRYRGNACPNWAILNGEPNVVLTIHGMSVELDAGPILVQRKFSVTDQTYIADIYRFAGETVGELFVQAISDLEAERIQARPQPADPRQALRCFPRIPTDGMIDWRLPAENLARLVRANAEPFAGAFTFLDDHRLTIWRARAAVLPYDWCGMPGQVAERNQGSGEVAVLTGRDVLLLQEVSQSSGPRQRAGDVLRSTRLRLGIDLVEQLTRLQMRVKELETQVAGQTTMLRAS